jgi:signal peptide peptidase SppA
VSSLINLSGRIFNTPLLIHPGKAEAILYGIKERLQIDAPQPESSRFMGTSKRTSRERALTRVDRGVALVDVNGTLVNKGAYIGAQSGLTSYEGLRAQIADAVNDPEVGAICLVIDSGGGEVGGMGETANVIRAARDKKPVIAVVDDFCCSAAYGLASQANSVWVSQTSTVGSIGVILVHMDHSGELQMAGVRPTIIKAGSKKASGNPFTPLDQDAMEELAGMVSKHYEAFLQTVAAGRGAKCSAKAARETEAGIFVGQDAITRGLADRVGTVEQAVDFLAKRCRGMAPSGAKFGASKMSTQDDEVILSAAEVKQMQASARADEKGRITAILRSDAAKGRANQALALALDTDMAAEQAIAVLAAGPVETQSAASLAARMVEQPTFGGPDIVKEPAEPGAAWGGVHDATAKRMGFRQ